MMPELELLMKWVLLHVYHLSGQRFFNALVPTSTEPESPEFRVLEKWFWRHAYPRAEDRRMEAIRAEIIAANPVPDFSWASKAMKEGEIASPSPEAANEAEKFAAYLGAEWNTLMAHLAEIFPGAEQGSQQWLNPDEANKRTAEEYPGYLTPPAVMGQLRGKFEKYRSNRAFQEFHNQLKYLNANEKAAFRKLLKKPAKKGRSIENLTPWLFFNEPVFRHYGFSARQILCLAILQGVSEYNGAKKYINAFESDQTPFLRTLIADHSENERNDMNKEQQGLSDRFERFLDKHERSFRNYVEAPERRLTNIRGKARSRNVLPFSWLVLMPEHDTETTFDDVS